MIGRLVVVLFGPSGAGKTTIARAAPDHFDIYDRDDAKWRNSEAAFRRAIAALAADPGAHAVVIRSGPTSAARARSMQLMAATHGYLVAPGRAICHQQAGHRRRHDVRGSHAYIDSWFERFDHHDRMPDWPGSWDAVDTLTTAAPTAERHSWDW